jgi:hypothetical protein
VFDHHCTWLSCCIGKRNYRHFMAFLSCFSAMLIFTILICIKTFATTEGDQEHIWHENIANIFLITANSLFGIFPFCLTVFHYAIILRGETTHEFLKGTYFKTINPFKRGFYHNIIMQLCQRRGKIKRLIVQVRIKCWNSIMHLNFQDSNIVRR